MEDTRQNSHTTEELTHDVVGTLDKINFWIGNCDTKVSFSLAFAGILLGGFFSSGIITKSLTNLIKKVIHIDKIKGYWEIKLVEVTAIVLLAFIILMAFSITYLFRALKGSIDTEVYKQHGLTTTSAVFFESIANRPFQTFKEETENMSSSDIHNDYLSQIYINSKICQRKFKLYNAGVQFLIYSAIIFVVLNILFLFIK
ncbi:DUF5706 domain-containing protein [Priestia filamentosa]|uniref:Pycsar system effector family protein n=1 Tax=Priestia filamentosa TaxID=1402861 RepID=UPI00397B5C74